jgi:hypothetical protein
MMQRVHRNACLADCSRGSRSRLDAHFVRPHVAHIVSSLGFMWQRAGNQGTDILNECPTEGDVEKLRSAADCENRFPGLARGLYKRYFTLIARAVNGAETLVTWLPVKIGIDVFATGEHEPIRGGDYGTRSRRVG